MICYVFLELVLPFIILFECLDDVQVFVVGICHYGLVQTKAIQVDNWTVKKPRESLDRSTVVTFCKQFPAMKNVMFHRPGVRGMLRVAPFLLLVRDIWYWDLCAVNLVSCRRSSSATLLSPVTLNIPVSTIDSGWES